MPYKDKETQKAFLKQYALTDKGKSINKKCQQKYNQSDKGKETREDYRKKQVACWKHWFRRYGFIFPDNEEVNYHHPPKTTKLFDIGRMVHYSGFPFNVQNIRLMRAEIAKCQVLSRSEHIKEHHRLRLE